MIFFDQFFQCFLCSGNLGRCSRSCRVDHRGIQNFSCRIYHSQLTAGTESRVPSQDYLALDRRLHKKLFQVLLKYLDSAVLGFFRKITADLSFNSGSDEAAVAVFHYCFQSFCSVWIVLCDHLFFQIPKNIFFRSLDLYGKDLFLLSPVDRQDPVACHLGNRFFIFIIHIVDCGFLRLFGRRYQKSGFHGHLTDPDPVVCLIGNTLSHNVHSPCQSFLGSFYFFFF